MRKLPLYSKLAMLTLSLVVLIACAPTPKQNIKYEISSQNILERLSSLQWVYSSGSVSPDFQYKVTYQLDFQLRRLVISVDKGPSVTEALPSPATKNLSDSQIGSIRQLVSQISTQNCAAGEMVLGGSSDYLALSTSSIAVSDLTIFRTDCSGYSESHYRQGQAAQYQALSNYLKSL